MRTLILLLLGLPLFAQNYASYSTYPVARMSFLRHQFNPAKNALGDSSLVGYWPLSEAPSSTMFDQSGNGWNGVYTDVISTATGKTAQTAILLNGPFANVSSTFTSNYLGGTSKTFTVTAWFLQTILQSDNSIFGTNAGCGPNNSCLHLVCRNGTLFLGTYGNDLNGPVVCFATNTWGFAAWTLNESTGAAQIYWNGTAVATGTLVTTGGFTFSGNTLIGNAILGTFKGQLQDLRVYNRILSASEIQAIYNAENH